MTINATNAAAFIDRCEALAGQTLPELRNALADILDDVNAARVASLRAHGSETDDERDWCDCANRPAHGRCVYPNC